MPNYIIDHSDGKIHTRYSELNKMTPGQVDYAMAIRLGERESYQSEDMLFGTERHRFFEAETKRTGKIPACFYEIAGLKDVQIDRAERELAVELVPGMVIHSRPDAYSIDNFCLYDYKTTLDGTRGWKANVKQYRYSKQGIFYAMMLALHSIDVYSVKYLCEIWNADRDRILGYDMVEQEITPEKMEDVKHWTIDRLALLKVALRDATEAREPKGGT